MEKMPEFKEGHITLWREGTWVQIAAQDMPKIIEEDNREPEIVDGNQNSADVPVGA